jgi:hypothetical protein
MSDIDFITTKKSRKSNSKEDALIAVGIVAGILLIVVIVMAIVLSTTNTTTNVYNKEENFDINIIENTPGGNVAKSPSTGIMSRLNTGKRASPVVASAAAKEQSAYAAMPMQQTLAEVGARLGNNTYDQERMERVRALEMASRQAASQQGPGITSSMLSPAAIAMIDASIGDQSGTLPPMIADLPGTRNAYGDMTIVRHQSMKNSFGETDLRSLDPETADEVDKALSLSAVPMTWSMDEKTQNEYKNRELMKQMLLQGAVDPSVEDIMALSAPYVGTAETVRRALSAQRSMDRSVINQPPMRFLYQSLTPRLPVPKPALSPFVAEFNQITPGLEYLMTEMDCANSNAPVRQEPY